MDGLIFTSKRFVANASWFMIMIYSFRVSLDPDRGNNMLVCKDYWRANIPLDAFSLCSQCPQPPNAGAQYKIQFSKHRQKHRRAMFLSEHRLNIPSLRIGKHRIVTKHPIAKKSENPPALYQVLKNYSAGSTSLCGCKDDWFWRWCAVSC